MSFLSTHFNRRIREIVVVSWLCACVVFRDVCVRIVYGVVRVLSRVGVRVTLWRRARHMWSTQCLRKQTIGILAD